MPDQVAGSQDLHNIALPWFDAGCSVVPIRTDGTKRPTLRWDQLQRTRPVLNQVRAWWEHPKPDQRPGVAVICGKVSGNLEMTELEGAFARDGDPDSAPTSQASLLRIKDECLPYGMDAVWEDLLLKGYAEWTPSGGLHLLYRISDHEVPGNTKIASTRDGKTLAETRGEGGYVIVAPTSGRCHPSGEDWVAVAGRPGEIPTITWAQRNAIHAAIKAALDESPPPTVVEHRTEILSTSTDRPGDDFNARADWASILEPLGWQVAENRGRETLWVRPGKDLRDGHSASTGYAGDADRLYVWSTSAGLPTEEPLSKFFVYAHYNHGGDFKAATRALVRMGYGRPPEDPWIMPAEATLALPAREPIGELQSQGDVPWSPPRWTLTDSGNANLMLERLSTKFRYIPIRNKWMMFVNGIWVYDPGATKLSEAIDDELNLLYDEATAAGDEKRAKHYLACLSDFKITAMIRRMRGRPGVISEPDEFDARKQQLNVRNGTIDLETLEFRPHDPDDMLTKKMNVGYNPEAFAPRWDQYLKEVLPDAEARDFLQRMVGYTLTGNPVERALAILHGPGGTGKSRFIEVLAELFGSYGCTAADSLFRSKYDRPNTGPSNDLNDLRGARLASVSELDQGIRMDEALVKRLTGFDRITSRGLYEENQTWMPQCVIWLATNHHFKIASDDGAIWHRIKVIPFTQEIPDSTRDPHILDKLLAEADGIFNWMLEGLAKYRERGLTQPESTREAVDKYKAEQDSVLQFLTESLDEGRISRASDDDVIEKVQLFRMYQAWSKDQGELPLGKTRFNRRMEALGYVEVKRSRMYWRGLVNNPQYGLGGLL